MRGTRAFAFAVSLVPADAKDADLVGIQDWMHAAEMRAKGNPKASLDDFRAATQRFLAASTGTSGGRGGKGASAGGDDVSPIGKALARWPALKPFATAKRVAS